MRTRSTQLWTGIAIGMTAAVLAPLLALAHHDSGEQSGDDPIQLAAGAGAGSSATASFRVKNPTEVMSYHVDISSGGPTVTDGRQVDENGTVNGTDCDSACLRDSRFIVERCTPTAGCTKTAWQTYVFSAPGWPHFPGETEIHALVKPPSGGSCRLGLTFRDFGAPRVLSSNEDTTTSHGTEKSARVRIGRSGVSDMVLECDQTSGVADVSLTSVDAAVYTEVAGGVRAIADATDPPNPGP